jgi:uncharacterized protein YjfI (DUF2170 family)
MIDCGYPPGNTEFFSRQVIISGFLFTFDTVQHDTVFLQLTFLIKNEEESGISGTGRETPDSRVW